MENNIFFRLECPIRYVYTQKWIEISFFNELLRTLAFRRIHSHRFVHFFFVLVAVVGIIQNFSRHFYFFFVPH